MNPLICPFSTMPNMELRCLEQAFCRDYLLKLNTGNRACPQWRVDRIIKSLRDDTFVTNGETVIWNEERLLNGQARVYAVAQSGIPMWTFVVIGIPSSAFNSYDRGKVRTPPDTLHILNEKNCAQLAATLGEISRFEEGRLRDHRRIENDEIIELRKKYPGARDSVEFVGKAEGLTPPSLLGAFHYLAHINHPEEANRFIKNLLKMSDVNEAEPVHLLRRRLDKNKTGKEKTLSNYAMLALIIKTWNAERTGKSLRYLGFVEDGPTEEAFPRIFGLDLKKEILVPQPPLPLPPTPPVAVVAQKVSVEAKPQIYEYYIDPANRPRNGSAPRLSRE